MSIAHEVRGDGRCEARGCRQYDFLPCRCDLCGGTYCAEHKSYTDHACRKFVDRTLPQCPICGQMVLLAGGVAADVAVSRHIDSGCPREQQAAPVRERLNFCAFGGCRTNEHVTIICRTCGDQFCITHRNEDAHNCRKVKNPTAGARTPPPPPASRSASTSPSPKNNTAASTSVEPTLGFPAVQFQNTMAKPYVSAKSHETSECVPVRIFFPPGSGVKPCYYSIHRTWVIGRVLDVACSKAGLPNNNNALQDDSQRLRVFSLKSFDELPTSAKLGDVAAPNDAMFICRYTTLPDVIMAEAMHYVWPVERVQPAPAPAPPSAARPTPTPTPAPTSSGNAGGSSSSSGGGFAAMFGFGRKKKWNCGACTFENEAQAKRCEMCGGAR